MRPLPRPTLSRGHLIVGVILVAALAIRVAEVQRTSYRPINDAASYLTLASQIAHTGDYSTSTAPGTGAGGTRGPSAYFPPAFPYFLALVDLVDGHTGPGVAAAPGAAGYSAASVEPARISQAVLGTIIVGLIGLVALEALGPAVGLAALVIGAVYPVLVELSAVLVAENLLTALLLGAVWAGLRSRRSPHPYRWIAAAGAFTGLAALAHVNALVIVIPLLVAAWRARPNPRAPALLIASTLLALSPWLIRDVVVMHRFVAVTDENGITLVGTYNSVSAHDPQVPYRWVFYPSIPAERGLSRRARQLTEPQLSSRLQDEAYDYIGDHPSAPLAVLYHNTRRLLELEGSRAWKISAASIDLPIATARIGVLSFWLLCLLAVGGCFTAAVRRGPKWLWPAPVLLWLSVGLVNSETPRFREALDPFLILLAACAVEAAVRALRIRLRGSPVGGERRRAVAPGAGQGVEVGQRLARP